MRVDRFSFGSIRIDGKIYENDVVLDRGKVRKRKKKASKPFRDRFGHTPLSTEENIPWKCATLVVGTGAEGSLPVMPEVEREARRRGVELVAVPTEKAIALLKTTAKPTNAVLHITCQSGPVTDGAASPARSRPRLHRVEGFGHLAAAAP